MGKVAFVFPGQGSQYVGMGQAFYNEYEEARRVYETASKVTGLNVEDICFTENTKINETKYTQIAMFTTCAAILDVLLANGFKADFTAGLSLGEYGALYASEVLPLPDLCKLVQNRGLFMQEACPTGGAMAAVLGLNKEDVIKACEATEGQVGVANYNCPGQIVITGEKTAVEKASENCKNLGARRVLPLKVSGPFHSPMLKKAKEQMEGILKDCKFSDPVIPYYTNVGAKKVTSKEEISSLLANQVVSSVYWQQTMEKMIEEGMDTMIEIGPGKTLCGFMDKIDKSVRTFHIEKPSDILTLKEALV